MSVCYDVTNFWIVAVIGVSDWPAPRGRVPRVPHVPWLAPATRYHRDQSRPKGRRAEQWMARLRGLTARQHDLIGLA